MRFLYFIGVVFGCSNENNSQCGCPPDFQNATTSALGSVCFKKHNSMSYTDGRTICEDLSAAFPVIDSDLALSALDQLDIG